MYLIICICQRNKQLREQKANRAKYRRTLCISRVYFECFLEAMATYNKSWLFSFVRIIRFSISLCHTYRCREAATALTAIKKKSPAWATNSEKLINKIWQQLRSLAFSLLLAWAIDGRVVVCFRWTDAHFSSKFPISIFIICVLFHRRRTRYRWSAALLLGAIYRGTKHENDYTLDGIAEFAKMPITTPYTIKYNETGKQHPFEANVNIMG